ncbi:type IX secretion system membrane protein PorP/SprF [Flavobacteriaceae bacterium TP-CH-4]|uniref:Type IX secretion system membrane protein PorP/SprF n=1 Tax=Pelagihabitans pacificus TaxID=2696054 RepID=A0A967AVI1_9FLAO|nr:PorP/SprF family type IX secretion system membrane protein [Pelagihabitans pacificus]NHF59833.1 type IX secretion system membrane protein PorP/SprF [Pelagihabitans pacificus]
MSCNFTIPNKVGLLLVLVLFLGKLTMNAQELNTNLDSKNTYHNQLFFNRFLINPTFSLVRENKSYINILHRNQYAAFEDNSQNYFLGFSNKINDHTALGVSVYSQWSGVVQEFGFNANYAKSIQLGAKSKLAFGTNITYFNEGLDKNRVVATEEDLKISESRKESKLAIQPGITLSIGKFDFGLYAEDMFQYNQTTNDFLTGLNVQNMKATLQYNHPFMASRGLFEDARLMPLVQLGKNQDGSLDYVGSLLLDLPNYGWLQTTYDETYGLSMGLGFNLSKKMSLGYLLEKDIAQEDANLGWNHEVSLAYTFKDNNSPGAYASTSEDAKVNQIIRNYEEQILQLMADKKELVANLENGKIPESKLERPIKRSTKKRSERKGAKREVQEADTYSLAYENRLILDELILRQDSIEQARAAAFEKRFETMFTLLRNDLKQNMGIQPQNSMGTQRNIAIAQTEQTPASKKASRKRTDIAAAEPVKKIGVLTDIQKARADEEIQKITRTNEALGARLPKVETTSQAPVTVKSTGVLTAIQKARVEQEIQRVTRTNQVLGATLPKVETDGKGENEATKKPMVKVPTTATTEIANIDGLNTIEHPDYKDLPIKMMDQAALMGVQSGYYVIVNVYSNKKYLTLFMNDLKKQGLDARQFYNKENGLYYVYLADFNYKEEAKDAYVSNLDGKYQDEKWIMEVADNSAIVDNMYLD